LPKCVYVGTKFIISSTFWYPIFFVCKYIGFQEYIFRGKCFILHEFRFIKLLHLVRKCWRKKLKKKPKKLSTDYFFMNFLVFLIVLKWICSFPALSNKESIGLAGLKSSKSEFLAQGTASSSESSKTFVSKPSKLNRLKYSGYSAEFLDRVEPNGNILEKNAAG